MAVDGSVQLSGIAILWYTWTVLLIGSAVQSYLRETISNVIWPEVKPTAKCFCHSDHSQSMNVQLLQIFIGWTKNVLKNSRHRIGLLHLASSSKVDLHAKVRFNLFVGFANFALYMFPPNGQFNSRPWWWSKFKWSLWLAYVNIGIWSLGFTYVLQHSDTIPAKDSRHPPHLVWFDSDWCAFPPNSYIGRNKWQKDNSGHPVLLWFGIFLHSCLAEIFIRQLGNQSRYFLYFTDLLSCPTSVVLIALP